MSNLISQLPQQTRALAYNQYGGLDVLRFQEVKLRPPGPSDVLVKVCAATVNPKDALVRKGKFRALTGSAFPKVVGLDFSGVVEWVGPKVRSVRVGDRVFGALNEWKCLRGTFAERLVVHEQELAPAPEALSFPELAAIPLAASTSLQALRNLAGLHPGQRVCIHGASGGVGTFAIQIAKYLGAHVTTTSSAVNLEFCRMLGADEALDYSAESPLEGRRYHCFYDVFGNQSFDRVAAALEPEGTYVTTVPSVQIAKDWLRTLLSRKRARLVLFRSRTEDLALLGELAANGRLKAVIQEVFPFELAVDALRAIESKRTKGKLVVELS